MFTVRKGLLTVAAIIGIGTQSRADIIVGLVGGTQLTTFDSATPGSVATPVAITGLRAGEQIIGIDFRPSTPGVLVGVGNLGGTGFVYTINTLTGAATAINSSGFTLTGTAFGVDFNPVPNALRIVSNAGQNLRITLGGTGVVNTDTVLSETGIVGAAYSNNFAGATTTTLYELSAATGSLVRQGGLNGPPSPNLGVITTIGSTGVTFTDAGFDISDQGAAFASLNTGNTTGLYSINLTTGQATLVGNLGGGVSDIAVQPVPAPAGAILLSLGLMGLAARRRMKVVA
jgi:Domain of unknown function (DUF4394)